MYYNIKDDKNQLEIIKFIRQFKKDNEEVEFKVVKDDFQSLFIKFGKDSFEEIGNSKVVAKKGDFSNHQQWEDSFNGMFINEIMKDEQKSKEENMKNKEMNENYSEKVIDLELKLFE